MNTVVIRETISKLGIITIDGKASINNECEFLSDLCKIKTDIQ